MNIFEACGVPAPQITTTWVEPQKREVFVPSRHGAILRCGFCAHREVSEMQHNSDGVNHKSLYSCKKCGAITQYNWTKGKALLIKKGKK